MRFTTLFLLLLCQFLVAQSNFTHLQVKVSPNAINKSISGDLHYTLEIAKKIDTVFIDAVNMQFTNVRLNNKEAKFEYKNNKLAFYNGLIKGENYISFSYTATPKQTLYFNGSGLDLQIWTQGQGKNTSHWLPSFDDLNEKLIFDISVVFKNGYQVLSNGVLVDKVISNDSTTFSYKMKKPMSSYLVMLAIGEFYKQEAITKKGTKLEYYIPFKDKNKLETTYRYTPQIFNFLENKIGVKYPWEVYRQVPVRDFLYAGMENTTATIFSQDFVVDSIAFNDKNYVNVNAHELAHQWFGNLITAKNSNHHWLHEGFATYYALLAEEDLFGTSYFDYKMWEMAEQLNAAQQYDTIPLQNKNASSLTFYKKGAWALHVLRNGVGAKKFDKAVKRYLKKGEFSSVETSDFLKEINRVSKFNTAAFENKWLKSAIFDANEAFSALKNSRFIQQMQKVQALQNTDFSAKKDIFLELFSSDCYYPIKQEILYQLESVSFTLKQEFIVEALASNSIPLRQALVQTTSQIPFEYKTAFETLLDDASYTTQEIALLRLWSNFPEDRAKYLAWASTKTGHQYNLKLAYLALQLATNANGTIERALYQNQLIEMANAPYEASVRQNALETLLYFSITTDEVFTALLDLSLHHKWHAVKYAKQYIRTYIHQDEYRSQFMALKPNLNERLSERLDYFLNDI